jgi:hypothetical protein
MKTQDAFGKMKNAARQAFDRVSRASNLETDSDLRLYNTLKPDDFQRIVQQYGANETVQYIQKMEAKRLMGGNNGKRS